MPQIVADRFDAARDGAVDVVARTSGPSALAALLAAAFVPPWLVWGSKIAQAHGWIGWHLPQGIALWTLTPTLFAVTAAVGGRAALRDLAGRVLRWRVPGRLYVLALAGPALIAAAAAGVTVALTGSLHHGARMSAAAAAGYLAYGTGLFLLTEETAWRGLLLPRLRTRMAPLTASLVLGVVWSVWHLPLLNVPGESDYGLPFTGFASLTTATSVLIGAVVTAARGSVLIAALFHASLDAGYSYLGLVGPDHSLLWAAATVTALAAGAVALAAHRPAARTAGSVAAPAGSIGSVDTTDSADTTGTADVVATLPAG